MEAKSIGRFSAYTFGSKYYEFIVRDNKTMYCEEFPEFSCCRMSIQPRFHLLSEDKTKILSPVPVGNSLGLICSFEFDENVFEYLKDNHMIIYSTDMAYFYNLPDKAGYDIDFQKRAFKHVRDKEKILLKQKHGIFN